MSGLTVAKTLWDEQSAWTERIQQYALDELLELKNVEWIESDDDTVTAEEFTDRMELKTVTIDDDESTTLSWESAGEPVSVTLPGLVHAEYTEKQDVVVTASAEGTIRILGSDGTERAAFEYITPEGADLYTVVPSIVGDLGVTLVLAHDPPHRGEALWQHEIDVDRREVSGPVAKWR